MINVAFIREGNECNEAREDCFFYDDANHLHCKLYTAELTWKRDEDGEGYFAKCDECANRTGKKYEGYKVNFTWKPIMEVE